MAQPATTAKKRALMASTPLRRKLRAAGHALTPVVHLGRLGVTQGVLTQVKKCAHDHELIKIKVGTECPDDRFVVADKLGELPGVNVVQIVGRVLLLYKRHPQKPRFEGAAAVAKANDPTVD